MQAVALQQALGARVRSARVEELRDQGEYLAGPPGHADLSRRRRKRVLLTGIAGEYEYVPLLRNVTLLAARRNSA